MEIIEFGNSGLERHTCLSLQVGNEIHYHCERPDCDYLKIFNTKEGTMTTRGGSDNVLHSGQHDQLKLTEINPN